VPALAAQDLGTMRQSVFFDGPDAASKLSRFWILLTLAAVIASAGVVADSTATVIGAMIVAPLMTPIQGTMLSVVIGDRANLARSIGLVVAGAAAAIAIGFTVGLLVVNDVVAETNAQVAGRVSPRLVDLLAALATGVVGSIALVRRDISETLPGVAIAISLVPPLTVVGLTLESGAGDQALGALLLFVTNVVAILATGTVVMALYGVYRLGADDTLVRSTMNRGSALAVIGVMVVLVGIPLAVTSVSIAQDTNAQADAHDAGERWADRVGWELVDVDMQAGEVVVRFEGPIPIPPTDDLVLILREHGVDPDSVQVELIPRATVDLEE
jgi:uncharacterized hydrophobic protein (TIGR00271 family)